LRRDHLATLLVAFLPLTAWAHDFWIDPSTFRPPPGSIVQLRLRVGQNHSGDPVPRNNDLIERFVAVGSARTAEVVGRDGADPAGLVRIDQPGITIVAYRSKPSYVELSPEKLEQYFTDEGLESIRTLRQKRGESAKPWREIFSRCAKALLLAGDQPGTGFDRKVGLRLELVPEKNPYALSPAGRLPVRLLYEGNPVEGALVIAINEAYPTRRIHARSDRNGRVTLPLAFAGNWLVEATHVTPAPAGTKADWESLWASLTFAVPDRAR
jgi:uncharacterized GH25 family protein